MFNINKIRAHIKMLEFEQKKLEMYLAEAHALTEPNPKRVQDIERALTRVVRNKEAYQHKISKFETAVPEAPARPPINSNIGGVL
jgi:hypothetical protein